jgi:predicted HTH domain antitoxin
MMVQVTVNIPDEFLQNRDREDFAKQMQLAAAIYWYSRGDISMGKAAELAGLSRPEFLEILAHEKIDVFQVDFQNLEEELNRA